MWTDMENHQINTTMIGDSKPARIVAGPVTITHNGFTITPGVEVDDAAREFVDACDRAFNICRRQEQNRAAKIIEAVHAETTTDGKESGWSDEARVALSKARQMVLGLPPFNYEGITT